MDKDNSPKVTIGQLQPIKFQWDESNTTVGVVAQEISVSMNDILSSSMSAIAGMTPSYTVGSSGHSPGQSTFAVNKNLTANTISTACHTIDIDELAEMMETVKKRLLILTPKFEQHEKYPMLKAAYDEYKMLEKLLGDSE